MSNICEYNWKALIEEQQTSGMNIDGYASIIQDHFKMSPFDDALYIFCNRHRDKLKCLY